MRVQSVQTRDNCSKPCFNAKFIDDHNGYIRTACNKANVTKKLKKTIETFSKLFQQTQLEILDIEKNRVMSNYMYHIYNHTTGKEIYLSSPNDIKHKSTLNSLLSKLIIKMKNGEDFFCLSILGDFIER